MDSGCSGKLCQTADGFFHISRSNHHQIGKLVDDDNDLRHRIEFFPLFCLHAEAFDLLIISLHIADVIFGKCLITSGHLSHCPVQCACRFFRISDYRNQKVWNTIIHTQFYNLRIDHDQFYFIGIRFV